MADGVKVELVQSPVDTQAMHSRLSGRQSPNVGDYTQGF